MHSKTAIQHITRLIKELKCRKENYTKKEYNLLMEWLERGRKSHKKYGGKIFAIGKVLDSSFIDNDGSNELLHWKGKIYAPIGNVFILDNPIDISEFNSFIMISRQSSITGVFGEQYNKLKNIISSKNKIPKYLKISNSQLIPIKNINCDNWFLLAEEYRRKFFLEIQFRTYYVDYLLKELGDIKTLYRECKVKKANNPYTYIDNLILFQGKYLPVEIKLNISTEKDLFKQLTQYINVTEIIIDNKKILNNQLYDKVLVFDTNKIYIFNGIELNEIFNLDSHLNLNQMIAKIKSNIKKSLLI